MFTQLPSQLHQFCSFVQMRGVTRLVLLHDFLLRSAHLKFFSCGSRLRVVHKMVRFVSLGILVFILFLVFIDQNLPLHYYNRKMCKYKYRLLLSVTLQILLTRLKVNTARELHVKCECTLNARELHVKRNLVLRVLLYTATE